MKTLITEPTGLTDLRRRLLLKRSLLLAGAACLPAVTLRAAAAEDVLLGGGRFRRSASAPMEYVVAEVRPDSAQVRTIRTDFFPHGFAFSPQRKSLAYCFEKIGNGAAVIDLERMEVVRSIRPAGQRQFYGHGVCTRDNRYLFSTETSPDGKGAIGVRDPQTLEYLGDFPTYGDNPHECRLIENDRVLMVTNGGGTAASGIPGALCYIDVHSRQLLHKAEMPDARFNTGHLYPLAEDRAVVVSAPRLGLDATHTGAVSVFTGTGTLAVMTRPAEVVNNMYGEALSIEVLPERDLFIVTHPTPGMLSFWSISQLSYRGHLMVENVRGVVVAADRKRVWVSCGHQADIRALNPETLTLTDRVAVQGSFITGSHLINTALI
ncbi:MAG: DUF1513 domain-containing protein [Pseudomonadota bacterium]|nr:DUF1513 domain-containing protein [Pseudomonadota bacterium]